MTSHLRLVPVASLLACVACSNSDPRGTLNVSYEFLGQTCDGIDRMQVSLLPDGPEEQAPCNIDSVIALEDVPAGNYELLVEALDSVGDPIRDNLDEPTGDETIEVLGGATRDKIVTLTPTPATLEFLWVLQSAEGFAYRNCSDPTPQFFKVTAFAVGRPLAENEFILCQSPPGFEPMPDPDREIDGDRIDGVYIEVLDSGRNRLSLIKFENLQAPGAGKNLAFTITCVDTTCTGTVEGGTPEPPVRADGSSDGSGTQGASDTDTDTDTTGSAVW
jgi:hypothetical protein